MQSGSRRLVLRRVKCRGQMSVELAVCLPVILALVGLTLNLLGYMNVCARFDRVAADAVRSQATSPGYGEEGSALAASRVQSTIENALQSGLGNGFNCDIAVSASGGGSNGSGSTSDEGLSFSLFSKLERYDCSVTYHPWPFSQIVFLQFFELTHTRSYFVDPFRPGVLF